MSEEQDIANIPLPLQRASDDEDIVTENGTLDVEFTLYATGGENETAPQPSAPQPSASQPSTSRPSTSLPSSSQPSSSQPSTSQSSSSRGTGCVNEETQAPTADVVASDYIYYKGNYMQVGDVVSIPDAAGGTFYAQIGSFLSDHYAEKRALITWLLPTEASPHPSLGFEPATYVLGPEDDTPHKLQYMQFVMHLPINYYKDRNTNVPVAAAEVDSSFG